MRNAVQPDVAKTPTAATTAPRAAKSRAPASTFAAVVLTPAEAVVDKAPPGLLRRLPTSRVALAGVVIIALWAILGFLAPWLPLQPPNAQDFMAMADPLPSAQHWLGVDTLGRDILSRLIWGGRTVLIVAPVAVFAAYFVGCAMGLLSGYYGSYVDAVISRGSDVILSFPVVVLYVILIANIGPSALNIIVAVVLASSPGVGRIVRGLVLELKEQDFVAAARLRRESDLYIMLVELLPNCRGPLVTDFCLRLGYTTITIGTLGFLGLGLPPPTPDWGGMVQQATAMVTVYPHMALFPCFAIVSLVLGFNLLADGLRELSLAD
jgi:peptide/nickel transport system permease protein